MSSYYRKSETQKPILKEFKILLTSVAILWAIEILDFVVFNGGLDQYGIHPREFEAIALSGILFAPVLHGGF